MNSNERPSAYGRRPYLGQGYEPPVRQPVPEETLLSAELQIERKHFTFELKDNPRGRFLRIKEQAGVIRNTIIIPVTGLDDFQRIVNEMAAAAKKTPATKLESPDNDSLGNR
jgi:hypothetical protein